jgi:hypothetical protein
MTESDLRTEFADHVAVVTREVLAVHGERGLGTTDYPDPTKGA